jgi:hypothetical protein
MRRVVVTLILAGLLVVVPGAPASAGPPLGAKKARIATTVKRAFRAMSAGNLRKMRPLLSQDLYRQHRALLEENAEYPGFLREWYRGATVRVDEVVAEGRTATVSLTIVRGGGELGKAAIELRKQRRRLWRISRISS